MKQGRLLIALAALPTVLGGCDMLDIFKADSLEAPGITLTGRVVDETGKPVPVRTPGGAQLRMWHNSWDLGNPDRQLDDLPVHLQMDGSYTTKVYAGDYDIQLIPDVGPWVSDTTRIPLVINGDMSLDVPVQPYYTIEDEVFEFIPPAAGDTESTGSIRATFRVRQHPGVTQQLELVGLYINTTTFVDRNRRDNSILKELPEPAGQGSTHLSERNRAQVQTRVTNNEPITITLRLPESIRETRSPEPRTVLYARVGVKTVAVNELAYSPVNAVDITIP